LKDRSGSTLLSQLRSAYSGEALGFAYSNTQNRIQLPGHSYRLCFVVSVQPKRALPLLNDQEIAGGTPGRFMWMTASDLRISVNPPPEPKRRVIEHATWRDNVLGYDVKVCEEAIAEIRATHVAKQHGLVDPIDGHSLLTQEKVAVALAVLADRDEHLQITVEDWELARIIMQESTEERASVQAELKREQKRENVARGHAEAERAVVVDNRMTEHATQRVGRLLVRKLEEINDWVSHADLRRKLAGRDRGHFETALDALKLGGQVDERDTQTDRRDRQGTEYRRVR
jgi:hypothetical protein